MGFTKIQYLDLHHLFILILLDTSKYNWIFSVIMQLVLNEWTNHFNHSDKDLFHLSFTIVYELLLFLFSTNIQFRSHELNLFFFFFFFFLVALLLFRNNDSMMLTLFSHVSCFIWSYIRSYLRIKRFHSKLNAYCHFCSLF